MILKSFAAGIDWFKFDSMTHCDDHGGRSINSIKNKNLIF